MEQKLSVTPKRNTKQKKLILCCLSNGHRCSVDGHCHKDVKEFPLMTAEELEENLLKYGHKVGIATIYRALKELCESGQVRRYPMDDSSAKYRYVAEEGINTLQLLCRDCGCIIDTKGEELKDALNKLTHQYGFVVDKSSVLYGECEKCSKFKR